MVILPVSLLRGRRQTSGYNSPIMLGQTGTDFIRTQWWPYKKKFHWYAFAPTRNDMLNADPVRRYYENVPVNESSQEGFQSTFSVSKIEALAATALLNSGKILPTSNWLMEEIFFSQWSSPNFREKTTNEPIEEWPVVGYSYDVLIGGLYPDQKPVWEEGMKGYTLELAFPVTRANEMLKRVRELFDAEAKKGRIMSSTYRSGINIKFAKAHFDFLGQVTTGTADGEDWSQGTYFYNLLGEIKANTFSGAIMFDFPTYRPSIGDQKRYNEQFCKSFGSFVRNKCLIMTLILDINLANTLVDEFVCRPHWTKNTRETIKRAVQNLDPDVSHFNGS